MQNKFIYIILSAWMLLLSNTHTLHGQCSEDTNYWDESWTSCTKSTNPNTARGNTFWLMFEFDDAIEITNSQIWNANKIGESSDGLKRVFIDVSTDGTTWQQVGSEAIFFPKGSEAVDYEGFEGPSLAAFGLVRKVLFTVESTHTTGGTCASIAEVKFNINPDGCSGTVDECGVCEGTGKGTYYFDADSDGLGNPSMSISSCSPPVGYVTNNSDACDTEGWMQIGPLFADNGCTGCHNETSPSGLNLKTFAGFMTGGGKCSSDIQTGTTLVDIINTANYNGCGPTIFGVSMNDRVGGAMDEHELAILQAWVNAGTPESTDCMDAPCSVDGGTIIARDNVTDICVDDGIANAVRFVVSGMSGTNTAWIVADSDGTILNPNAPSTVDFEGASAGTCYVYHVSYEDITNLEAGKNVSALAGCFNLSNRIDIVRMTGCAGPPPCDVVGGTINTTYDVTDICVDDGIANAVRFVVSGMSGTNTAWIVADSDGKILNPDAPSTVDFEGAGAGTCYVYHVSYEDITNLEAGKNVSALAGCFNLSNRIDVTRVIGCATPPPAPTCEVVGGTISTTDDVSDICVDDGRPNRIKFNISGKKGLRTAFIVTARGGKILNPNAPSTINFEGTGAGICRVYHISYKNVTGLEAGKNISGLSGCFDLSNRISIVRLEDCTVNVEYDEVVECEFERMGRKAIDIGSGGGETFVVAPNFRVYKLSGDTWNILPGGFRATRIDVTDTGVPWVVTNTKAIYYFTGTDWTLVPGIATDIGCSGSTVCIVGDEGVVAKRTGSSFTELPGQKAFRVDVFQDGNPWIVGADNYIYKHNGSAWTVVGDYKGQDISITESGNKVWSVSLANGTLHCYEGASTWQRKRNFANNISVGSDQKVWTVNRRNDVYLGTCTSTAVVDGGITPGTGDRLIINGTYVIRSRAIRQNIIATAFTRDNAIMYYAGSAYPYHNWVFKHLGGGKHTIKNVQTDMFLDVNEGACADDANVATLDNATSDHTQWYIEEEDGDYYLLPVHCETHAISKGRGYTGNVTVQSYNRADNKQKFDLITPSAAGARSSYGSSELYAARGLGQQTNIEWDFSLSTDYGRVIAYTLQHYNETEDIFTDIHSISGNIASGVNSADLTYTHKSPVLGNNYYQVKIEFASGRVDYSDYKLVEFKQVVAPIDIAPNPAQDDLYINLSSYREKTISYYITGLQGQILKEGKFDINHSDVETIELNNLQNGIYLIHARSEDQLITSKKFVVLKK